MMQSMGERGSMKSTVVEENPIAERFIRRWVAIEQDKQHLLPDVYTRIDGLRSFMEALHKSDGEPFAGQEDAAVRHFAYQYVLPTELEKQRSERLRVPA